MRAQRSQRKNKTAPICGDGSTKCRWDPDGDLFMDSDGVVHAKPLGSRLHALYAARGTATAPSGRRRGAVLLHGAARTFVLAPVHGAFRAHVVKSFADSLGAPCDVFAAVSLYDERTARPRRAEASAFRNASRSQLLRALHALSPASPGRRRPQSSIAWSMLHFDCAPPTRRFDEACTRSNKRAGFKHTPTMVIQATQIEAAYELLRREAAPRSVADAYDWVLRTRPDMWWAEPPRWTALLASRVPKTLREACVHPVHGLHPADTRGAGRGAALAQIARRLRRPRRVRRGQRRRHDDHPARQGAAVAGPWPADRLLQPL